MDPHHHSQSPPYVVYTSTPPPLTPQSTPAQHRYDPRAPYSQPQLLYPPYSVAPPHSHAYHQGAQFGWSHPIFNGNSWEAPARAPHYPQLTPTYHSVPPPHPAPPPTAPVPGAYHQPVAQLPSPGQQPIFQGAQTDAWYEPSVEEHAQRLEGIWRETARERAPPASSQPTADRTGLTAEDHRTQQSPVPAGILEAIVDGPVTYSSAETAAGPASIPSPPPPVSGDPSLSARLPPDPAPHNIRVRHSYTGIMDPDTSSRPQSMQNRQRARQSSGPGTLLRHLPSRSDSPLVHSTSGSDSDRGSPRSRRRKTRTRAVRRNGSRSNSEGRRSDPESGLSLAALRRSIMEEVRREIQAEMRGQLDLRNSVERSSGPSGDTPGDRPTAPNTTTRGVTWRLDTAGAGHTEATHRPDQRQLALRRRSSLDTTVMRNNNSPVGSDCTPSEDSRDHDHPPHQRPGPDYDGDTCEIRALVMTIDGGSLWIPCPNSPHGLTISTLPSGVRPRSPPSVSDVGHFHRLMRQIGIPLPNNGWGGRHGFLTGPALLANTIHETWAIVVDRSAADLSMAESRPTGALPLHRWEYIPPNAPESAMLGFDSDALVAWSEASSSEWYRELRRLSGHVPRLIDPPIPAPPLPPPLSARPAFPRSPPLSSAAEPFEPGRPYSAGTRGHPSRPTPSSSPPVTPSGPSSRPPVLPPGMLPVKAEALTRASAQEIREEHKTKEMVMKCVKATPKFPAKTASGSAPSDDEILLQLEQFARATKKLFDETIVREALITPSCTPALSDYLASVPSLLWDLKENVLGDKQKRHLERAAGGTGYQGGWQTRYNDLDTFFCDLALCSLKQHYLERVFDETKAMRQRDKESASDFFARLDARRDAVNFLARKVAQCVHMSDQNMLTTFRAGLRYAGKVMRRLHQERLDISKPEEWEQRAKEQNFPGTHVALLKLREIADNVETDMESKAADKLAAERASRSAPFSPSSPSNRPSFFRNRTRAPLAVMEGPSAATAAVATSPAPTPTSSAATSGVRRCFACGSPDHIVRNCPDEAKLQAWKANAPPRLAKQPQHVAAVVWSSEQAQSEDLSSVPEIFVEEVCALMECEEVEPFATLCQMCDIEVDLGEEPAPDPAPQPGEQK
ncbi:hypothetical protein CYMTET_55338 [Cymbomonas tetramitiformis]|uniref:CCHC-type domain-containing protein n=1 Tax=Cymbomonas tetramitiformis TaxID=36881 RepID=A0AAE0EN34_9CHLO|nr:hypothetical protein CYMTET_55338 [Cymbomonas tetramitiformis]